MECVSGELVMPELDELKETIQDILLTNFDNVSVDVVECPDLTQSPYELACSGLGGQTALIEVGGVPNLMNPQGNHISFGLQEIVDSTIANQQWKDVFFIGAAAGDANHIGVNSELIPCELMHKNRVSKVSYIVDEEKNEERDYVMEDYDWDRVGFLANLFASEGETGKVIRISAACRTGEANLITCLREGLKNAYEDRGVVGMGGVFRIAEGQFKAHIMPDFMKRVMLDEEVENWLHFYEFDSGAVCLSTFITGDPRSEIGEESMHLRVEHTHFFNKSTGQAGHYHYDTTPDVVQYEGFFMPAARVYRVEDPY